MEPVEIKTEKFASEMPSAILKEFKVAAVQRGVKLNEAWAEAAKLWTAREQMRAIKE